MTPKNIEWNIGDVETEEHWDLGILWGFVAGETGQVGVPRAIIQLSDGSFEWPSLEGLHIRDSE